MKRILISALALLAIALPAAAQDQNPPQQPPQEPSLADAARAARAQKKASPKRVFDNDTLPKAGELNVMGEATAEKKDNKDDAKGAPDAAASADALAKQIDDKKALVDSLTKEIDLLQREHKLKQTLGYVDVGNRLRDQKKWDDDEKKYTSDLADRQKQLAAAQKDLATLQSQAKALGAGK